MTETTEKEPSKALHGLRRGFVVVRRIDGRAVADAESFNEDVESVRSYAREWYGVSSPYAICPATLGWLEPVEEQCRPNHP